MTDEIVRELAEIALPFGRRAILRQVDHESGLQMMRLVLFEGKRVTQVDMDPAAAEQLGTLLVAGPRPPGSEQ